MAFTAINHKHPVAGEASESGRALPCVAHTSPDGSPNGAPKPGKKRTLSEYLTPAGKRPKTAIDHSNQISSPNVRKSPFQSLRATKPMSRAYSTGKDMPCMWQMTFNSSAERETSRTLARLDAIHSADADAGDGQDLSDAYPLDDDIAEDDIVHLLAGRPKSVQEDHIPPSSVREWDHGSQSVTEYDPTLKHSPPNPQETDHVIATRMRPTSAAKNIDVSEDLLDEDVDWNAVLVNTNVIQEGSSPGLCPKIDVSKGMIMATRASRPNSAGLHPDETGSLAPFSRPPFPEKIRDRPSVPGMSSNTLLRTCFRIGAMISQTARCFNHQQDVMFELYARVTYSNRESLVRKQHFQFVDLFKDQHPYPAATLTSWRAGSQLDKDSLAFLDTSGGPRLCWCMCKPVRDPKAAVGWTYAVLSIKEIDWEQIRWAKRYICGDSEEGNLAVEL
ncbi:hypothetical protein F4861DRAFT_495839 [Xylaria intraflava]|nr:hypothetical protein F4861DRAFT_495839 [Xylaria intraflava]